MQSPTSNACSKMVQQQQQLLHYTRDIITISHANTSIAHTTLKSLETSAGQCLTLKVLHVDSVLAGQD